MKKRDHKRAKQKKGCDEDRVLILTSVASMIDQFNRSNIDILLQLGYKVDVACNYIYGNTCSDERIQELKADLKKMGVRCFQIDFTRSVMNFVQDIKAFKQVKKLCKTNNYIFVHCQSPIGGVIGRLVAAHLKTKVIYTAHGFHFYKGAPLKNWLIYYPVEKMLSYITDVLITINKEDYNRALGHFHASKTIYIPGVGVDTAKFATCPTSKQKKRCELDIPSDAFVLLSVGELRDRKNHRVVIEAMNSFKGQNIVYLLVGQGELEPEYKKLITVYGLESNIRLLGFRKDIGELCKAADVFIHPSVRERFGISLMEAMASGLPIIASNINGMKDYVEDDKTGICVDPTNVQQIISAINRMQRDDEFRVQCGMYNALKAKSFDIKKTDDIMEKLYEGGYCHLVRLAVRKEKRDEFGFQQEDFVIISVGELNENKNHSMVIKAISKINYASVKYVIVGQGIMGKQLRKLSEDLGIAERIVIAGYRTDIRELLWMSDCFAFPSIREGLGLAALEGMAAGLPLVTSNVHGINDYLVPGETGYSYSPDNVDGFANGISRLWYDCTLRMEIAKHVQKEVRKYDIHKIDNIMRKVYQDNR